MGAMSLPGGTPETITEWRAVAQSLLTQEACAFHRNVEISTSYAWIYKRLPSCFKWAGMAAIASHHVRLALFPLWLDRDRRGYVDIQRSLGRHKSLLIKDVNTIRETNNAIYDDIFWVHLVYLSAEDGVDRLRALLGNELRYAALLSGFESIDRGRRVLEDDSSTDEARLSAERLIWDGNVQLLEHEQRALVQPHFDGLSCAFARLVSLGATTTFEVRGARSELAYFTSFYLSAMATRSPHLLRTMRWPRITNYDDRWNWIVTSVVPRFRKLDADMRVIGASLRRIFDEGRAYSSMPCVLPHPAATDPASVVAGLCCPNAQRHAGGHPRERPVAGLAA